MSPRSPQQFKEIREEKKALIMDVALEHFSNVGFHATTINHIARHAGISKGLMYNYFRSKEELLSAILSRSLTEVYYDLDADSDGHLSGDEFEFFIRKIFKLLREKKQFWKLIFRILLQPGVFEDIFNSRGDALTVNGTPMKKFSENMMSMLIEYFNKKKENSGSDYDPVTEMFMFINTIKGFAVTYILAEEFYADDNYEKMMNEILKRYK